MRFLTRDLGLAIGCLLALAIVANAHEYVKSTRTFDAAPKGAALIDPVITSRSVLAKDDTINQGKKPPQDPLLDDLSVSSQRDQGSYPPDIPEDVKKGRNKKEDKSKDDDENLMDKFVNALPWTIASAIGGLFGWLLVKTVGTAVEGGPVWTYAGILGAVALAAAGFLLYYFLVVKKNKDKKDKNKDKKEDDRCEVPKPPTPFTPPVSGDKIDYSHIQF
ncbi:MAG: hypothetical protein AABZ44_06620 [Elusimicrobiota bacterium]